MCIVASNVKFQYWNLWLTILIPQAFPNSYLMGNVHFEGCTQISEE
jgi:hypothetical protein